MAPTLSASAINPAFTENGSAVTLFSGATAATNDPGQSFSGITLTVSNVSNDSSEILLVGGTDVSLNHGNTGTLTGVGTFGVSVSAGTATITITGMTQDNTQVGALVDGLSYRNTSDDPGSASRVVTIAAITDSGSSNNSATPNIASTVTVAAVNDAPSGSPLPTDLSFTEDVSGNLNLSSVTLSDPDAGADSLTLTLTASAGTLSSVSGGGITVVGSGSGTLSLTGTLANLNTFLDAPTNISYTGAPNVNGENAATVTVKLNDNGHTGTGGALETPLGTVNVDITAVNDAPTLVGSATIDRTISEDVPYEVTAGAFAGFFSDPDSASLQIAITGSTGTGWQYDDGSGWLSLGSVSETQALLLGTGSRFRYLPQAQNAETATLTFRAWDRTSGTASSGGTRGTADTSSNGDSTAFSTGTVTLTMTVTAVNDVPDATNRTQSITYNEDPGAGVPIADIVVTEPDAGDTVTATLTLSPPAAGSLSIGTYGSLTSSYNAGTGVWTAAGSVANVNAALSAVAFSPAANWAQPASITTRIRDAANTGPADGTLTLAVTPVNDAPVATITPASYTATEQTALTLKGTGLSIADVDASGADVMAVTVAVTEGTLTATAGTSGATVSNSGTATVSITGTLAQVNALMDTDGTSTLSYFNSSDAPSAGTTLTLHVSDGGATGTGGTLTGTDTAAIAITAVNDSPTVAKNTGASAATGGLVTITAAMLNEGDPDDSGTGLTYTVTTAPAHGTLFKDVDASNTADPGEALAANGTFTQDDLDQGRIKYLHGGGAGGADPFVFSLADGGEDGSTAVTNQTFTISVAARPVVSPGGGAMPSYSEGLAAVAIDSALTVSDSDSASLEAAVVTITDRVDGDTLTFISQNGITGSFNTATGELSLSGTATLAAYQTALQSVTYASTNDNPATGAGNNTRVIRFTVADAAALASVPVDVTIAVENTNDAPTLNPGESPALVGATEDAPAPSNGSTAGSTLVSALLAGAADVDTGAVQGLALIGATAQGTLWYSIDNGTTWTQAPAVTETNALLLQSDARLYLQPSANVNGSITDAITFKAWDRNAGSNGGTGDSTVGSVFSTASDTASVAIAAVADTPSAGNATINEDTTATIVIARNPADGAETTHYKITALTNGALFSDAGLTTPIANGAFFTSAGTSTSVYFRPTLNFAGAAGFTVQAASAGNDAGLGGASAASVITVNAVNDAPTDITLSDALVAHNEGVGAVVGTLSATDVDDATFTFALVTGAGATDNARFAVDGANLKLAGTTLPPHGTYSIRIQADDGDTGGTFAETFTIEVDDNVAPVAPSAPDLLAASDLGVSATDNLTADTTPTFTGTAEAGSTVRLYADATEVGSATAATDGNWTITASTLAAGTYTFTVTATDLGTNTSAASAGLAVTIKTTAPEIDTIARQDPVTFNTTATPVTWRVRFTEAVTGVDEDDFAVSLLDGEAAGAVVSVTQLSTLVYDVEASVSGQGALRLDLNANGTGIVDLAGNAIDGGFTMGDMYIVGVANVFDTLSLTTGGSVTATAAGASKLAQRFTTAATEPLILTTVTAALGWTYDEPGAPVPVVTIHADNGDVPAAAVLATLDHPGALEPHALNVWTGNLRLTASTTYWVVFATTPASTGRFEINTTAATSGGQGTWLASPLAADYKYRSGANQTVGALRIAIGATSIPAITSSLTASGTSGTAFSYQITATHSPTSFAATGLPTGLSLNTDTGLISGTPTQAGTFSVSLTGTNAAGTSPASSLVLTIAPEPTPPSKESQTITFTPLGNVVVGDVVTLSASASSGLPVTFSVSGPATLSGRTVTCTGIGAVTVRATQPGNASYNAATAVVQSFTVGLPLPTVTTPTQVPAPAPGGTATLTVPTPLDNATYRWQRNGADLTNATNPTLTLPAVQPPAAGLYTYTAVAPGGATATSEPVIVGLSTTEKVIGTGELVGADIHHPNGNIYDQLLLEGTGATFTAEPAQVTRMSYVDLSGDIVQVEFSGAGSLSLVMDDAGTPAPAANYNQPGVNYVRGHVGIVITGADETTNVSVFSVGRITAVNQALFRDEVAYDGVANVAFIAIQSTNGKFGGVRTGNVEYYAQSGFTGLYAPGVAFSGPVNIGDIQAFDNAQPLLVVGSASNVRIAGGSLSQPNGQPVTVNGLTQLTMAPGQTSQGAALPALANQGVLEQDGVDVTDLIVAAP